jgi:hypothetical protein
LGARGDVRRSDILLDLEEGRWPGLPWLVDAAPGAGHRHPRQPVGETGRFVGHGLTNARRRRIVTTSGARAASSFESPAMFTFILWCLLFVFCWPLALLALVLYPIVWLLSLPFRLVGISVGAVFALLTALLYLPARALGQRR